MDFVKAVPKPNTDLSYDQLQLTPIEGYLLSRIDGVSSVDDIASLSGLPYDQALGVIRALWEKRVFVIDGLEPQAREKQAAAGIDLTDSEKDSVERMLGTITNGTFYQILSVPPTVKPDEVKKKFFELSKVYHPDRYFKKNIGPYKEKLTLIFKKLSEAYEVLYDPRKKKWYDAALAGAQPGIQQSQSSPRTDVFRERSVRVPDKEATVRRESPPAAAPHRPEPQERTVKMEKPESPGAELDRRLSRMKETLDSNELEQGLRELDSLKEIRDPRIPLLMADYYLRQNDLLSARDYTQMAIEYDTGNIKAYEMLGSIYMKFKLYRNALKVYETIKDIAPEDTHAEKMIQEIKSFIED